jgi:hypothetical protein
MLERFVLTVLAATLIVAGCGAPAPSTVRSPIAGPALEQTAWQAGTVLPTDEGAYRAAALRGGRVTADATTWVEMADHRWMPAETIEARDRVDLIEWHGVVVSWGDGGVIRTSRDGLTWTDAVTGPGESNPGAMVPLGDELWLVGEGIRTRFGAWSSKDGSVWRPSPGAPIGLRAVATLPGGGLVGVGWWGLSPSSWTTRDGTTWPRTAGEPQDIDLTSSFHSVAASGARVVAVGDSDGVPSAWSSHDLKTWSQAPNLWGEGAYLSNVAFIGGSFVIAGRRGSSPVPVVWRSLDGLTWTSFELPIAPGVEGEAIETRVKDGKLVVFGFSLEDAGNGGGNRSAYLVWTLDVLASVP